MLDTDENDEITIKTILIGNSGVGKTNLINTSIGEEFNEKENCTTGGSFVQKKITINNKNYILNLWDTAGQENYKSITKIFLKKSLIVIFVYDITDKKSFEDLELWIKLCKEMIDNNYICGIVGNKTDLYSKEQVSEEDAQKFADSKGMKFKLVSAKKNPGLFNKFLEVLVDEFENGFSENIEFKNTIKIENIPKKKKKCNC